MTVYSSETPVAPGQAEHWRLLFLELSRLIIKATQCLQSKSRKMVRASPCLKENLNKQKEMQRLLCFSAAAAAGFIESWEHPSPGTWGVHTYGMCFLTSGAHFSKSLTSYDFNLKSNSEKGGTPSLMGRGIPSSSGHQSH